MESSLPHPPEKTDASTHGELLAAVCDIVDGLRCVHAEAANVYREEVEAIIRKRSRDIDQIERTLDGLVAFCGDGAALRLFKRLCRYYWDLDPEATARHVLVYREWFDSDGDAGTRDR